MARNVAIAPSNHLSVLSVRWLGNYPTDVPESHPHQQRDGEECYASEWECDKRSFDPNAQARHQTWEPHRSTGYIKGEGG